MNRPICIECNDRKCEISGKDKSGKTTYRKICWKCRSLKDDDYNIHYSRYQKKLRYEALKEYGGKCECCGEDRQLFLTIDHINNDGAEEKKSIGGGYKLYRWLRNNGYPKDRYRILCLIVIVEDN